MPDRLASAGEPSASRWATITTLPLSIPGLTATTFSSVREPSTVRPVNVSIETAGFPNAWMKLWSTWEARA